ncbi:M23 family metallopeptidase [Georgenia sp. H159]|uniref:M23 family metallopeptidase n=1 Tax=Georgenia sp. H159 TaxID=3076115 RepID=UPI002D797D2C|nr:M23 family metallopeptidase [Georgenia sp. H159]
MPVRASMPTTAPLTRRQIREAERLAEQAALRRSATRFSRGARVATVPLDGRIARVEARSDVGVTSVADGAGETQTAAAVAETATGSSEPQHDSTPADTGAVYRTRAERRAAEQERARAERRTAGRRPARVQAPRWMPRAAVVGALGAVTIVAPIAGFAGPAEQVPEAAPSVATVPAGATVLDSLDAAATQFDTDRAGSVSALLADSGAAARALVQSSRSSDRSAAMCRSVAGSGANGAGAALGGERVVMPLVVGSYSQSSLYGNRVHPIFGTYTMHAGLDFAAPLGTDIHAVADGVVVHAGEGLDGRSSMLVIIEHEVEGETFYSWYVHMYPDGVFVTEGQQVRAGEVIGEVGNNGNSTGPHLHLEIHLDEQGTTTDPGAFLADRGAVPLAADC